jgi:hypothetical protein
MVLIMIMIMDMDMIVEDLELYHQWHQDPRVYNYLHLDSDLSGMGMKMDQREV